LEIAPNDGRFRQPQFVVALAFVEPSARASRKLDKVVKHALSR
jgi:hypothetical protein